jgi:hypothetical protein
MTPITHYRWPDRLAWAATILAALASAAGLLVTDVYRDNEMMVAQARGSDLATLFAAVPALALGLWLARRGSFAGRLAVLGAIGYLAYSYAIYAFQVVVSPATPVHIAILGLASWSLILGGATFAGETRDGAMGRLPRRTTATFLALIVILFGGLWLSQIAGAIVNGVLPASVTELDLPTSAVYSLDLAFALPVLGFAAWSVARRAPRGPALAVAGLVFVILMALSIVGLFWMESGQGIEVDPSMTAIFVAIAIVAMLLAGLGLLPTRASVTRPGDVAHATR